MTTALIVDDEPHIRTAMVQLLTEWGFTVKSASSVAEGTALLRSEEPGVAFVDVRLGDGSGLDLIRLAKAQLLPTVMVLITGHGSIEDAVEAMRLGAEDYLTKPIETPRVRSLLDRVTERMEAEETIRSLRQELRQHGLGALIGESPAMQKLYTLIERVGKSDASVLITGQSGTGKTVIAQTIHDYSKRRKKSFVAVNCAAISPTLIESELFGHEKGAFTGAAVQRRGLFEEANTGTIFLDEISEMPIELQAKLLSVLEEGKLRRVGGSQEIRVNVRLITATNRDPQDAIRDGKLREDLYYRINIFPIHAPSLRERVEDIELLANTFLERICKEEGRENCRFSKDAVEILKAYPWPGNVRELRNVVNRAVIVATGKIIGVDALPDNVKKQKASAAA